MKAVAFFITLSAMALACCKQPAETAAPVAAVAPEPASLSFVRTNISLQEPGCNDTTECTTFDISYPEFESLPEPVRTTLLQRINNAVGYDNPDAASMTMQQKAERFMSDYQAARTEFPDMEAAWYFQATADVLLAYDTLISLVVQTEFYTGGAHGGYHTAYVNLNPKTNATITLADLLKPGYEEALRTAAERIFRQQIDIADGTSYADAGYEFPNGTFALNNNYGFTKEGIVFNFNPYEIAPYVIGATEILIPYSAIREWRK